MTPVVFSTQALGDLREIGDRIAKDNALRSVTFVTELIDKAEAVGRHPLAHRKRDDVQLGLRGVVHGRYIILFRVNDTHIDIVHIVHGARDLPKLFPEPPSR